jgi:hypothetical protein
MIKENNRDKITKIRSKLRNLSSIDYNKKLTDIGKSVKTEHIELERVLINIINVTYDIRFNTDKDKEALKILEQCKSDLVNLKWK